MHITMVKKILADGSPCKKCAEIDQRLDKDKLRDHIDEVVLADVRDNNSAGMLLAAQYQVALAPFFIVKTDDMQTKIYTVYFQFKQAILNKKSDAQEINADILDQTDLDYI